MSRTIRFQILLLSLLISAVNAWAQGPDDNQVAAHFQAAQAAEKTSDYEKAASEYKAALKLRPQIAEIWVNLGLDDYVLKKDNDAIAAFGEALKRKPDLTAANLFLGMAYLRENQYAKSIGPLQKALALNPKELRAYINLSVAYQETGHADQAVSVLEKANLIFPRNTEVLFNLGRTYSKLMERAYKEMAEADADSYRYHQVLGDSYELRRDYPDATAEYKLALAKCPDPYLPGLHYSLGAAYWMEAKWDLAIEQFNQELAISPENYQATWKLGDTYLSQRKYDQARLYLEKALRQKPDLAQADRDMGKLCIYTGQPEQALTYLEKVVQLDPEEPSAHYLLAQVYRKMGRQDELNAELQLFQKLKKQQSDRSVKHPDATLLGGGEANERPPEDESLDDLQ